MSIAVEEFVEADGSHKIFKLTDDVGYWWLERRNYSPSGVQIGESERITQPKPPHDPLPPNRVPAHIEAARRAGVQRFVPGKGMWRVILTGSFAGAFAAGFLLELVRLVF